MVRISMNASSAKCEQERTAPAFAIGSHLRYISFPNVHDTVANEMARGQQKIQAQQKNAKKQAEMKKNTVDQKKSASKALIYSCPVTLKISIRRTPFLKSYWRFLEGHIRTSLFSSTSASRSLPRWSFLY
ncbi:unnamed protein product [Dicrocoelium dendriticum]|nr:unnamed protein product [Dicrocoelium dendriticum]